MKGADLEDKIIDVIQYTVTEETKEEYKKYFEQTTIAEMIDQALQD